MKKLTCEKDGTAIRYTKNPGGGYLYRIGICDDEISTCTEIEHKLKIVASELDMSIEVFIWYSGESLLASFQKGCQLDFLLLDIELFELSGIDLGKYLREENKDYKIQIIYISSKRNYAMQLFQTQPLDFLIKPVSVSELNTAINRGVSYLGNPKVYFEYCKNKKIHRMECNEIMYFYSDRKLVNIIGIEEKDEYYGKLKDVQKKLPENFLMIHQSFIINLNYVKKYTYENITMADNSILNISKSYIVTVRKTIFERMVSERNV